MTSPSIQSAASEDRNSAEHISLANPPKDDVSAPYPGASEQNQGLSAEALRQSVPISLRLQIGALDIPFSQISTLSAGQVISLRKPLNEELITIYANDVAVAVGELVCIDAFVGVQIRRMLIGNSQIVPGQCVVEDCGSR